jgi:FeS assembly SUF system regulator
MIRLNRMTDYAVVMLVQMGRRPDRVLTAPQIAQAACLPLPTVAKLMKQMGQTGLVRSQRGAAGGYALSRRPEEITVAEIIAALEGPIALTACVDGAPAPCEVRATCPIGGHWNKVNGAIEAALRQVTLADLASEHATCGRPPAPALAVTAA